MHRITVLLILLMALAACGPSGIGSAADVASSQTPGTTPLLPPMFTPTPLLEGAYIHRGMGLSLIVPLGWEMLAENETGVAFADPASGLVFAASSEVEIEPSSLEEAVLRVADSMAATFQTVPQISQGELELPGGILAQTAALIGTNPESHDVLLQLVRVQRANRSYKFLVLAPLDTVRTSRVTLERVFHSLQFLDLTLVTTLVHAEVQPYAYFRSSPRAR